MIESRQSYSKESHVQFFLPTLYIRTCFVSQYCDIVYLAYNNKLVTKLPAITLGAYPQTLNASGGADINMSPLPCYLPLSLKISFVALRCNHLLADTFRVLHDRKPPLCASCCNFNNVRLSA